MGTDIRPEISSKNRYYIDRQHFCLQYPYWFRAYYSLDGIKRRPLATDIFVQTSSISDPTSEQALKRLYYRERMDLVESTALETDSLFSSYILHAVTEGVSYVFLKAKLDIPCCKNYYYELYRRFFWLLSNKRT